MTNVKLETGDGRRSTIKRAVSALGDNFIQKCKDSGTIFIKVNLVHHERQLASTHVDAVRGTIDAIREHTGAKIFIGDASYSGTKAGFRNFGYDRLPEEHENVELIDLNDDNWVDGYSIKEDGSKNKIRRSKTATEADLKISLTPLKLDKETGISLTVKNWTIGTWLVPSRISATGRVWARWPWLSEEGEEASASTICELFRDAPCDIGIIDGIIGMEGDGPANGNAVLMNVVLAGFDPVAVDAVGTTLMGIDPGEVLHLLKAQELELGSIDMTRIDVPPMQIHELSKKFNQPL